ncbi:MAG: hypothetical protein LAT66_11910 [Alkalimonas sp.]|nr:hypothetical protein [Alkalimonas sp.]
MAAEKPMDWPAINRTNAADTSYATPSYQTYTSARSSRFGWVIAAQTEWMDAAPYTGLYLAAQAMQAGYYTEIGVFGQRLPRDGDGMPDKTRYFMSVRFGMDSTISPYAKLGFNPLHLFNDSDEMRLDMHAQAGISWQLPQLFRLDLYGAVHSLEYRRPYDPNLHAFDRGMQSSFQRQNQFAAGVRINMVF